MSTLPGSNVHQTTDPGHDFRLTRVVGRSFSECGNCGANAVSRSLACLYCNVKWRYVVTTNYDPTEGGMERTGREAMRTFPGLIFAGTCTGSFDAYRLAKPYRLYPGIIGAVRNWLNRSRREQ